MPLLSASLGLLLLLFSLNIVAANKPQDHLHSDKQCVNCHQEGIAELLEVLSKPKDSCTQCHTVAQIKTGDFTSAVSFTDVDGGDPKLRLTADAGMRFPLLYQQSRIGAKPNKMVSVPAGKFIMGTNSGFFDEGPPHEVTLDAFMIDQYEVTNLQYETYIKATNRRSPIHFRNRTYPEGKADHPVIFVGWGDAVDYCTWADKRLPSGKEWEKAARGSDGRTYPWGELFDPKKSNNPVRWRAASHAGDTTPVGAFEEGVSVYGLYDTAGNVWEWTDSWYTPYPGNEVPAENYGERYKTLKGGSWFDCSFYKCGFSAALFNRSFFAKRTKNDTFGFRCAKDVPTAKGGE
ncbi:MAG: formylglycine-generating enzyme family protein [Thiotrichaceae bacterium]|nr:formylglycine-generating enzyme family protein [Thiotrichaceae bacterium]PCI15055.1 MAG: hypothetical protein COB71_00510 [Thiotrichales bacterium]